MYNSIIEAIFKNSENTPEKLCLADDGGSVTYKEYKDIILKYAACLVNIGIKAGDKVVVEACQTVDYLAIMHALQVIDGIFVPVEHNCAAAKIKSFGDTSSAKTVIACKENDFGGIPCYTFDFLKEKEMLSEAFTVTKLPEKDAVCEILFSTGTTGKEKGIVLTHKNNIALAKNVMYGVEMEKDNVEMIPSPMNHSHGLRRYYANMYNGSSVVLLGSVMDVLRFFNNIDKYGVNSMDLVPAALSVILKLSKTKLSDYKDKIRYIQLGSAPLPEGDKEKICGLLPSTRLYNFYGSTESGCTCIYNFNTSEVKQKCIGKPTHCTELIFVDDERNPIESSSENPGLIATKGDMNMSCYYKDEEETKKALCDNIVYSNDIGYFDDDGDVILLGRKTDIINVAGKKVSPQEIEDETIKMDGILDCACIPVDDAVKGQVPKLFVKTKTESSFDPVKIRAFLQNRMEPFKVPQYIEYIPEIPRSFNGKILRKELK